MTLAFMVDNQVMRDLSAAERQILQHKLGDPLFLKFLELQRASAQTTMAGLDPDMMDKEEFYNAAKEMRLVLRFWNDLREFCSDWGKTNA